MHRTTGHGRIMVESFVKIPQCPWCSSLFSTVATARQHVRNSFMGGNCVTDRGITPIKVSQDQSQGDYECQICQKTLKGNDEYNRHVQTHVSPPECITLFSDQTISPHIAPTRIGNVCSLLEVRSFGHFGDGFPVSFLQLILAVVRHGVRRNFLLQLARRQW